MGRTEDLAEALLEAGILTARSWDPALSLAQNAAAAFDTWAHAPERLGGRSLTALRCELYLMADVRGFGGFYDPDDMAQSLSADLGIDGPIAAFAIDSGDNGCWRLGPGLEALVAVLESQGDAVGERMAGQVAGVLGAAGSVLGAWTPQEILEYAEGLDESADVNQDDELLAPRIRAQVPAFFFRERFAVEALRRLEDRLVGCAHPGASGAWRVALAALKLARALERRRKAIRRRRRQLAAMGLPGRTQEDLGRGPWSNDRSAGGYYGSGNLPLCTMAWGGQGASDDAPDAMCNAIDYMGEGIQQSEHSDLSFLIGFDARPGEGRRSQVALVLGALDQHLAILGAFDRLLTAIDDLGQQAELRQRAEVAQKVAVRV